MAEWLILAVIIVIGLAVLARMTSIRTELESINGWLSRIEDILRRRD